MEYRSIKYRLPHNNSFHAFWIFFWRGVPCGVSLLAGALCMCSNCMFVLTGTDRWMERHCAGRVIGDKGWVALSTNNNSMQSFVLSILGTFHVLTHLIIQQSCEVGNMITLQMTGKLVTHFFRFTRLVGAGIGLKPRKPRPRACSSNHNDCH